MWLNLFQKRREKSLDDDAQRIREASESAAETIKTRLSSLPADETLFVLVGENHAMPAHMIFQMCLFDILRKAKLVFGVALEHPSNWVVTCSLNLLSEDPQTKVFTVSNAHRIIDEQLAGDPVTHQLLYAAAF
jgi:hypothetical protein